MLQKLRGPLVIFSLKSFERLNALVAIYIIFSCRILNEALKTRISLY